MGDGIVKTRIVLCIVMSLALLNSASAAGESGVNIDPIIEDTIFSEITYTETTSDLEDWEISLTLNDDALNNNTTFILSTQICVNDGYCLAPEEVELNTADSITFTGKRTTIEDHTYVNWKVEANYTDDNSTEFFPSSGFYKVWSDCWFDNGTWGGPSTDCQDEDEGFLHGFIAPATVAGLSMAALTGTSFQPQ